MKKIVSTVVLFSLLALALTACGGAGDTGGKEIIFANAGWESMMFHNAVAGLIAEEIFGYSWKEVTGTTAVMYEGQLTGEVDVHMECWTDNIEPYADDLAAGRFKELSVNFDDNFQGIYVPRYVIEGDAERGIEALAPDLKYIWDLKDYPEVFPDDENPGKGRMYGSIPGWEIDDVLYNKYLFFGLDENFIYFRPGSDPALQTAIMSAYDKGEPIAAYYWEPTWLLGMYDMVLLEDEPYEEELYLKGECEVPPMRVTISASNNFADNEDNEEFIEFLRKYKTSSALTSEALAFMQETGTEDYIEVAKWFLKEHDELLDAWLGSEDAESMRSFLSQ
ncbi:MAG: ABC transporter substrate-binding protein [Firmicutes bacterium]|nr:ABC transporter substrate-binding protein [Bacillota bacterium]